MNSYHTVTREYIESQPFDIVANGREVRLNCPNCDDTTKHLYVNQDRQKWYCFKCGKGGTVLNSSQSEPSVIGYNTDAVMRSIKSGTLKSGDIINVKAVSSEGQVVKSLPLNTTLEHIEIAEDANCSAELSARNYLHSRGVTQVEIDIYSIRASLERHGPHKNTVIFPVYGSALRYKGIPFIEYKTKNNLEYFVCRKWDGSKPKYVNAPWPKYDSLFIANAHAAPPIGVIVEGILDAIAINRVGFIGVALLGKKATSQQLNRLSKMYKHYLIYLDDDALVQAVELALQLKTLGLKATVIRHAKDAADLACRDVPSLYELISDAAKK